jgi:hypothetical protein
MVDDQGNVVPGVAAGAAYYSSTGSYHSSFGIDDPINWRVDSGHMSDVQDSRL